MQKGLHLWVLFVRPSHSASPESLSCWPLLVQAGGCRPRSDCAESLLFCVLHCFPLPLPPGHMDPVEEGLEPCPFSLPLSLSSPLPGSLFSNHSFGTKAPQQTYILSIARPLVPGHLVNLTCHPLTTALPSPEPWSGFPLPSKLTPGLSVQT